MSELKARRAYFSEDEYDRGAHKICAKVSDCGYDRRNDWWSYAFEDEVYLKSEADKVIAELKAQKAQTEDDCAYWKAKAQRERYSNYRRCVAMARWCESENYTACWYHDNSERCEWTEKWHKRWLELAEKFKEAK